MLKIYKYLTAIFLTLGIFVFPGMVLAQTSVFDKFEEVRKYQGAEMLGAADRATYGMSETECSVFILMLEDELKRNLSEVNKPFLEFDTQQIMKAAFGADFDAAKLDDVSDYNVKSMIRQVLDSGYAIKYGSDSFYAWPDYEYLINAYSGRISAEVKDYFALCHAESENLLSQSLSLSEMGKKRVDVILLAESYLNKYPDAYRKATVATLYRNKLSDYLVKMPNFFGVIQDNSINDAVLSSYKKTAHAYPETRLGWFSGEVAEVWENHDHAYNGQVMAFLADIDKQIDMISAERVSGIYLNNKGLGIFKAQGEKGYMLLSGQISQIQRARQQFSKDLSQYVMLELKGITEKTIPVDIENITYPKTFVVENVLGAHEWAINDEVFRTDFVAFNNSPVWSLRILTNDEVIFEMPGQEIIYIFPYQAAVAELKNGRESYTYNLSSAAGTDKMTIVIVSMKTRDRLQGIDYNYKATVTLNGQKYEGYAFKQGEHPGNPDRLKASS